MPVAHADGCSVHGVGGPPIRSAAPLSLRARSAAASGMGLPFPYFVSLAAIVHTQFTHGPLADVVPDVGAGSVLRANLQPLLGDARIRTRLSMSRSDTSRDRGHRRSAVQKARCAHSRPASNKRRVSRKTSDDLDQYGIVVEGARRTRCASIGWSCTMVLCAVSAGTT